jgi:hypothetical protein
MTDIAGIVQGLRAFNEELLHSEPYTCEQRAKAAAHALEAQAARIAELEEEIEELREVLRETLAIAERNELGDYQLRARAKLNGEKG